MTRVRAVGFLLAALTAAPAALADLESDADFVSAHWSQAAAVVRLPVRFYGASQPVPMPLPPSVTSVSPEGCSTVAVLGAMSTTFVLRLDAGEGASPLGTVFPSVAGAAEIVKCGKDRLDLTSLSIEMRSPHGVIETVVANSKNPLPSLRALLPHRDPGIPPPSLRATRPVLPAPLGVRAERFERVFAEEGASTVEERRLSADSEGGGKVLLDLASGCHRLGVLGGAGSGRVELPHDIDAELAWASGGIAASDRTDSADATLAACTAERKPAILAFAGALPDSEVVLVHGVDQLPRGIPEAFGEEARARIAKAFLDLHARGPSESPVYSSLGIAGITDLPIEVDPGQCYFAVVTPSEGDATLVALAADVGSAHVRAHTEDQGSAVLESFCTGTSLHGALEIEVHGTGVVWVLALFRAGALRLGEEAP